MRISKSTKTSVKAAKKVNAAKELITLTPQEKQELKKRLYDQLDALSEYHEDLAPEKSMSLNDLMEAYFYWGDEYNDGYLGFDTGDCEDKLDCFLLQEFKQYLGDDDDIEACGDVKASKKLSANDQALTHIKAAIDILGKSGQKDAITKDTIANLGVVMFDLKGNQK